MQHDLLAMLRAVAAMPLQQRQARYSELAGKVASLVPLSQTELDEIIMLRNLLQNHAAGQTPPAKSSEASSVIFL